MVNVGIFGATGLVGLKILQVLEERNFPVKNLKLFASEASKGEKIGFKEQEIFVEPLTQDSFENLDIAFFALDETLTKKYVPEAQKKCLVIDNSPVFRLADEVPLIIPEVNGSVIKNHQNLIANPNCCVIPLTMVLSLLKKYGINRVVVTTFQSVSGKGREALDEFRYQLEKVAYGEEITKEDCPVFTHPIGANIIPQIGEFLPNGETQEEAKIVNETRKILEIPNLMISATCVRVPTFLGHCLSVYIEFSQPIDDNILQVLSQAPIIKVLPPNEYPMPVNIADKDEVFVGRVREFQIPNSKFRILNLWIGADNLRKGAATNAVQIAEMILNCDSN